MSTRKHPYLLSAYPDLDSARAAVHDLYELDFPNERVSILTADREEARQLLEEGPGSPDQGGRIGGIVGATLWGLGAAIAAPLGIIAAGPLVTVLIGAGLGAGVGTLLGRLAGMGIPEHEAVLREKHIREGGVLIGVELQDDVQDLEDEIRAIFERTGAEDVFRV